MKDNQITLAAQLIKNSSSLLITAGAGMSVCSGLPCFRGPEGFWNAYPAYKELGLNFAQLANPKWFKSDPELAWGFYGHRQNLYRKTKPHNGYQILRNWANKKDHFIFTSNIDGHFQKTGFSHNKIVECHGSLEYLQCIECCGEFPFPSYNTDVIVCPITFKAIGHLPTCPSCRGLARPNVMMFSDWGFDREEVDNQLKRLELWMGQQDASGLVVVECGAGKTIPTVRNFGEYLVEQGAKLIRINTEKETDPMSENIISLQMASLKALNLIENEIT